MEIDQILNEAGFIIEKHGWFNGERGCSGSSQCPLTAFGFIEARNNLPTKLARKYFLNFIGRDSIAEWNDAQPSKEIVIAALRNAAVKYVAERESANE